MQDKKIKKSLIIESRLKLLSLALQHKDSDIVKVIVSKVLEQSDLDKQVVDIITNIEFNLKFNQFENSINEINDYLNKKLTIVVKYEDGELKELKQQLKKLEIKFQELIEEKTEYLNDIEEFNTQYSLHVGDLIKTILNLKKEILYKKTIKNQKLKKQYKANKDICDETKQTIDELKNTVTELEEILENIDKDDENYEEISSAYNEIKEELEKLEDELILQEEKLEKTEEQLKDNEIFEEEYEEAKATYEQFDNEYEHIKDTQKDVIKLDEEQQKELKILFKKAAKLCHPDIVADELKEKAHEIMQSLNDAYSKKDIEQVKKILLSLESGTTFKTVSSDIEDKELLLNKIKEFEQNISDLKDEIEHIKLDDTFTTISQLDNWDEYFEELKNKLAEQKNNLEKEEMEVLSEKEEMDTFSQVIVVYKDIFIEEWIEKIWIWADYYNISKNIIPRNKKELLSIKELDLYNYYLNDVPEELINLSNLTCISLRFEENLKLTKRLIFFIFFKQDIDCFGKDERCVLTLNKIPIWIIDFLEWIYDYCCTESLKCFRKYDYIDDEETIPSKKNAIYLEELDFYNNGLEEIPEYIGKFHNLKVLKLGFNELVELPKSIIKLKNLKLLQLHGNPLRITEEQTIWMEELKKNGCKISCIDNLDHKNQLYIFEDLSKDTLVKWIQKLWDWADENNISNGKLSRKKENLLAMTTIDFTGLKLKNICKEIFNLKNISTFSLWDNDISFLPNEIINFTNLKKLNLRGNPNLELTQTQKDWIDNLKDCTIYMDEIRLKKDINTKNENKLEINEEESDYSNIIKSIEVPNFEKIRRYCNNLLNDNLSDDMQEYLANNGKMYKAIIYDALEQFISKLDGQTISLVDWGCGQGIASMVVLDYIKEKQLNIKIFNSILIDDDIKALSRAMVHSNVLSYSDDIKISAYDLNSDISDILEKLDNQTVLNLMVNDRIYEKIENIDFDNDYFICLSNQCNVNIDKFYKELNNSKDVENLSIRDCKIGKFGKFERIFKLNDEIPF
jgi:hypothetical protein